MFNRTKLLPHNNHRTLTPHFSTITPASSLSTDAIRHTALFKNNPIDYLKHHIIDTSQVIGTNDKTGKCQLLNEIIKKGYFALVPDNHSENVKLMYVNVANSQDEKNVIYAHWIPYCSGDVAPGYTDIPKYPLSAAQADTAVYVFTPGMNGCSLELREHPQNSDYFRVFHNQHPTRQTQKDYINTLSGAKIGSFEVTDYFQHTQQCLMPLAFNFMHHDNRTGVWVFISQAQAICPVNNTLSKMPYGEVKNKEAIDSTALLPSSQR